MTQQPESMGFEQKVEALETLVQDMERGGMTLADMLTAYEKGVALVKELNGQLAQAQQRLQVLKDGALTEGEEQP